MRASGDGIFPCPWQCLLCHRGLTTECELEMIAARHLIRDTGDWLALSGCQWVRCSCFPSKAFLQWRNAGSKIIIPRHSTVQRCHETIFLKKVARMRVNDRACYMFESISEFREKWNCFENRLLFGAIKQESILRPAESWRKFADILSRWEISPRTNRRRETSSGLIPDSIGAVGVELDTAQSWFLPRLRDATYFFIVCTHR